MCVIAIAWQAHPRWRLVVAANRDEYHDRPAEKLHRWPDSDLIAGRDLIGRGTWLAVSEQGRFAAVTNLRQQRQQPADPEWTSRGLLVTGLALGQQQYEGAAIDRLAGFGPFQAISVSGAEADLLSNRPTPACRRLAPGILGISNGPFDRPWRKSRRLGSMVERWLNDATFDRASLLADLRDPASPAADADDPGEIFVSDPVYGTRCSTVVTVDQSGDGVIVEVRYDRAGNVEGTETIAFRWP
ncbi:NRDE family protein [Sphingomonas sp. BIUV-7]|uniref:NRDE family protein n=1 Tax=Sphingomonas natans TaxID=3063330 RepID=A0ABT8Y6V5_9SPHN|nr:NRDE family protein [Sphingomonas sp. BIUV-7]MDO6414054.1 NRDE family protein [Sphingomonas sp. BIUV-7]